MLSSVSPPLQRGWVVSICQLSVPASDTESCHFSSGGIGEAFCSCLAWLGARETVHAWGGLKMGKKKKGEEASQGAEKQVKWRQLKKGCRGAGKQHWTKHRQHHYALSGPVCVCDQPLVMLSCNCSTNTYRCLCQTQVSDLHRALHMTFTQKLDTVLSNFYVGASIWVFCMLALQFGILVSSVRTTNLYPQNSNLWWWNTNLCQSKTNKMLISPPNANSCSQMTNLYT